MKLTISAPAKKFDSDIIFGRLEPEVLDEYIADRTVVALLADQKVYGLWASKISPLLPENTAVITFNAGDEHKNLETYQHLLGKLKEAGCDRKSVVLSLGGGVASDIVGFVAASYMRGIDWLAIPTTLMAQTDAAIGGKTGVNLGGFKNMIGSFWPPKATLVDPEFLETLDQRELSNGVAEIIKMGIIYDKSILNHLEKISADATLGKELDQASKLSAKGKVEIVNTDPFEAGERKIVNFGHSVGHAIEAISHEIGRPLLHGEAISIGMIAEAKLAELEELCDAKPGQTCQELFNKFDLPTKFSGASVQQIIYKLSSDKKNEGDAILWTLPTGLGQNVINHQAKPQNIEDAINFILA